MLQVIGNCLPDLPQNRTTSPILASASYEKKHCPTLGQLRPNVFTTVRNFLRCGDLASGFLRFHCSDCGHERILAFTCILLRTRLRKDKKAATSAPPAINAASARPPIGAPPPSATKSHTANSSSPSPRSFVASYANASPNTSSAIPSLGGRSLGEDPSLQKITWNPTTQTVIYRSKRHHTTKRNFEIFKAPFFPASGPATSSSNGLHPKSKF